MEKREEGGKRIELQFSVHAIVLYCVIFVITIHSIVTFLFDILFQPSTFFLSKLIKKTRIRTIQKVRICFKLGFNPIERELLRFFITATSILLIVNQQTNPLLACTISLSQFFSKLLLSLNWYRFNPRLLTINKFQK